MRLLLNLLVYYVLTVFLMVKGFPMLAEFQARFYSNQLNSNRIKRVKKEFGKNQDQLSKKEINKFYDNLDDQRRRLRRQTREQNWTTKATLDQQRARQRDNKVERISQRQMAKRLREEQSQKIADIKARQRDLMDRIRRDR